MCIYIYIYLFKYNVSSFSGHARYYIMNSGFLDKLFALLGFHVRHQALVTGSGFAALRQPKTCELRTGARVAQKRLCCSHGIILKDTLLSGLLHILGL